MSTDPMLRAMVTGLDAVEEVLRKEHHVWAQDERCRMRDPVLGRCECRRGHEDRHLRLFRGNWWGWDDDGVEDLGPQSATSTLKKLTRRRR